MAHLRDTEMDKYEKAAKWWAESFKNPTYNNGVMFQEVFLAPMLYGRRDKDIEHKLPMFIEYLSNKMREVECNLIQSDYGPDKLLSEAMEFAEIDKHNASWKTMMLIEDDKVLVAQGYGSELAEI